MNAYRCLAGVLAATATAWAAAAEEPCTATLTDSATGYNLFVPFAVPLLTSGSADTRLPYYAGNFGVIWNGTGYTARLLDASEVQPPSNLTCPPAALSTLSNGAYALHIPRLTYQTNAFSTRIEQVPNSVDFLVQEVREAPLVTIPPKATLKCVGVRHFTRSSQITVCVSFDEVYSVYGRRVSHSSTAESLGWSSRYDAEQLYSHCRTYSISSYGTYSGVVSVTTNGGSASVPWNIAVTSAATPACDH